MKRKTEDKKCEITEKEKEKLKPKLRGGKKVINRIRRKKKGRRERKYVVNKRKQQWFVLAFVVTRSVGCGLNTLHISSCLSV
jgi:hypothetical protein